MAVKLVFIDLDGTFVDSQKRVCKRNVRALERAAELGVQFVPCTGRNSSGIPAQIASAPSVRYAVCCNGGSVVDLRSGRTLHAEAVETGQVARLYEAVRDLRCTFDVFIGNKVYLERSRWEIMREAAGGDEVMERFLSTLRTPWDGSMDELLRMGPVTKLTMLHPDKATERAVRAAVDGVEGLAWTYSLPVNTEVQRAGVNKGSALRWLCGHLGVDVDDAVAFGDGDNDVEMLRAAGDGVAMGNAADDVKACADHVTATCDEAGVAAYLEPLFAAL
ncbi:Cof-type HAD-IIB family hydrolase [Paratractidigestivibacter sp.]|uniref:Cof-type HAD-IIB family hydrolase n=1 Tax=Paratractidigestivibacter sp. TaxID=2847316 RepID=UPI002AC92B60|nr:Cof-type HAD-IIB family hydrolase [Paratractidigestivibacter sp.]